MPVPSTTMTRRLFSILDCGRCSKQSAVWARMSESICCGNFFRAVQYEAVEDEGILIPLSDAYDCSLRITSKQPPSASSTWLKKAQKVFSLENSLLRLMAPDRSFFSSLRGTNF